MEAEIIRFSGNEKKNFYFHDTDCDSIAAATREDYYETAMVSFKIAIIFLCSHNSNSNRG